MYQLRSHGHGKAAELENEQPLENSSSRDSIPRAKLGFIMAEVVSFIPPWGESNNQTLHGWYNLNSYIRLLSSG